jgi:hypothetical protein
MVAQREDDQMNEQRYFSPEEIEEHLRGVNCRRLSANRQRRHENQ